MKLQAVSITGKVTELEVQDGLFSGKVNALLMAQAVRVYLANQRISKASTKTRSMVSRTKAKWYRQKGTGRARHGARTPNIFVGGGVSHGPTGNEQHKLRLTKSMRVSAMLSALASKKDQSVLGLDLEKLTGTTKDAVKAVTQFAPKQEKTLFVTHETMQSLLRGTNNLQHVMVTQASRLNVYELLLAEKVVFTQEAIQVLASRLLEQVVVEDAKAVEVVVGTKAKSAKVEKKDEKTTAPKKTTVKKTVTKKTVEKKAK